MLFSPKGAGSVGLLDFPRLIAVRKDAARRARLFTKPNLT